MNLDYQFIADSFLDVASYIPVTLKLAVIAFLISFPFGVLMAVISHRKIKILSTIVRLYISIIRGTPTILQIYVIYTIAPYLASNLLKSIGSDFDIYSLNNIYYAYIALSLSTGVSIAEAVRSGLGTVNRGQYEAGLSVGLSGTATFMRIIFPQAISSAMPVIGNIIVDLLKTTSLAYMMAVTEVMGRAKILGGMQLRYFEAYLTVFIIYIVLIATIERLVKLLEKRMVRYRKGVHSAA